MTADLAAGSLGPEQRARALAAMAERELDILVVGGGVVGCGSALDATTRGLSTALVEARDYASGTSSRSSKLIHGGLRYLEMLDFGLVREALTERGLMLDRLAPHLVRPVRFLYPLTHRVWERAYVGAGILLYDTMSYASGASRLPWHRHLSRNRALAQFPSLRRDALVGAVEYSDAQVDDARHTMNIARTAAAYGALVANRAQVVGFLREGERVTGAWVRDGESGAAPFAVRARQVINATGVWTDETQGLVSQRSRIQVRASKGIHLVVPRDRIHGDTGLILRTETSVLFVIPWGRHWIIGTTDTEWNLDKAHPAATRVDIRYLLDQVNRVLVTPLELEDVEGVYAGLRPLLAGESESTSRLSREHTVNHAAPGLVVVAGGKYTTYRVMAKDAVDAAARGIERVVPPCCTDSVPLLGANGYHAVFNGRLGLAQRSGLHPSRIEHLLGRYGTLCSDVLELIARRPGLARPLPGADDYLEAEVLYAASHEGARHLDDTLTRRTRISIESWDRGLAAAEISAGLMGEVLGWGGDQVRAEVEQYRARVAAERRSQELDDDGAADRARLDAGEIKTLAPLTLRPGSPETPAP